MLKNKIMPTVILSSICIVIALLLSIANLITAPHIEKAQKEKAEEALRVVYPDAQTFDALDISKLGLPEVIDEVYRANDGGYVFKSTVSGYKDGLVIMCGVDPTGKITDSKYIESNETNGAEAKLDGKYKGASKDTLSVVVISGSTKTSDGYRGAIEASLTAFEILTGGK